jgi:hypothetical protein
MSEKRCGGGKVNKFRYANFLIFSDINGGKQLLLYIESLFKALLDPTNGLEYFLSRSQKNT